MGTCWGKLGPGLPAAPRGLGLGLGLCGVAPASAPLPQKGVNLCPSPVFPNPPHPLPSSAQPALRPWLASHPTVMELGCPSLFSLSKPLLLQFIFSSYMPTRLFFCPGSCPGRCRRSRIVHLSHAPPLSSEPSQLSPPFCSPAHLGERDKFPVQLLQWVRGFPFLSQVVLVNYILRNC